MSVGKNAIIADSTAIPLESHLTLIGLSLIRLANQNPVEEWDRRDVPIDNKGNFVEQYSAQLGQRYRAQIWRPGLRGEAHAWVLQIIDHSGADLISKSSRSLEYLQSIARHLVTDLIVEDLMNIYGVDYERG